MILERDIKYLSLDYDCILIFSGTLEPNLNIPSTKSGDTLVNVEATLYHVDATPRPCIDIDATLL